MDGRRADLRPRCRPPRRRGGDDLFADDGADPQGDDLPGGRFPMFRPRILGEAGPHLLLGRKGLPRPHPHQRHLHPGDERAQGTGRLRIVHRPGPGHGVPHPHGRGQREHGRQRDDPLQHPLLPRDTSRRFRWVGPQDEGGPQTDLPEHHRERPEGHQGRISLGEGHPADPGEPPHPSEGPVQDHVRAQHHERPIEPGTGHPDEGPERRGTPPVERGRQARHPRHKEADPSAWVIAR